MRKETVICCLSTFKMKRANHIQELLNDLGIRSDICLIYNDDIDISRSINDQKTKTGKLKLLGNSVEGKICFVVDDIFDSVK